MRNKILHITLIITLLLVAAGSALAAPSDAAVDQAIGWLKSQQNADGGFSNGFSPESAVSATADAIVALAAGGQHIGSVRSAEGASALDYLAGQAGQLDGVGTVAKVVLALVAANEDPTAFAGQDLVDQIEAAYDANTGSYGGSIFDQALVVLALANANRVIPEGAIAYLFEYQTTDGAWNFMGDTVALTGDTNTTALVIQALAAAGRKDDTGTAQDYLRRVQNSDAGWPYQNPSPYGTETDANSTAFVLQAIYAVGQTPGDWYREGSDPLGALLVLQNANGSFSYQNSFPGDNMLATIQAIPAVAGATLVNVRRAPLSSPVEETPVEEGTTETPSLLLPEAGEGRIPVAAGLVVVGLLLTMIGLVRTRSKLVRE